MHSSYMYIGTCMRAWQSVNTLLLRDDSHNVIRSVLKAESMFNFFVAKLKLLVLILAITINLFFIDWLPILSANSKLALCMIFDGLYNNLLLNHIRLIPSLLESSCMFWINCSLLLLWFAISRYMTVCCLPAKTFQLSRL